MNIIALTATATRKVVEDIKSSLLIKDCNIFQTSFYRNNLFYKVYYTPKEEDKLKRLMSILRNIPFSDSGIIYGHKREKVEELCDILKSNGYNVDQYHAGMSVYYNMIILILYCLFYFVLI